MELRHEFVLQALEPCTNLTQLCRDFGISRKTGYKWLERYQQQGFEGLKDDSRRPKRLPNSMDTDTVLEIMRLKTQHLTWGPKKIHALLEKRHGKSPVPSLSSVVRILDRAGLVRRVRVHRRHPRLPRKEMIQPQAPNDVWTMDFKGWWRSGHGARCEPFTVRDEYSRFILSVRLLDQATRCCVQDELIRLFQIHGLPKVIRCDNGQPFACTQSVCRLTKLSAWMISQGIQVDPTNPGSPQDNGGHERMHKDIRDELEIQGVVDQEAMDLWRQEFNWVRPHEALRMQTPSDVYVKSNRVFRIESPEIVYSPEFNTRRVDRPGYIKHKNHRYAISTSLTGYTVGVKRVSSHRLEVWFDYLFLGWIDENDLVFIRQDREASDMERHRVQDGLNLKKVLPMS